MLSIPSRSTSSEVTPVSFLPITYWVPLNQIWCEEPSRGNPPNFSHYGSFAWWINHVRSTETTWGSSIQWNTICPIGWTNDYCYARIYFFQTQDDTNAKLDNFTFKIWGELWYNGKNLGNPTFSENTSTRSSDAFDRLFVTPIINIPISGIKSWEKEIRFRGTLNSELLPNTVRLHGISLAFT